MQLLACLQGPGIESLLTIYFWALLYLCLCLLSCLLFLGLAFYYCTLTTSWVLGAHPRDSTLSIGLSNSAKRRTGLTPYKGGLLNREREQRERPPPVNADDGEQMGNQ